MPRFLSVLRGVNVGGQKIIKMSELVSLYQDLGFKNILTYIQSGNVIFDHNNGQNLSPLIEKRIVERFNAKIPVLIRSASEMFTIIAANPFLSDKTIDISSLYLTFLSEKPDLSSLQKITQIDSGPDRVFFNNKEIYLFCPHGYGRTKLNNNFLENKLKLTATTRNWKTVIEIDRLMH